MDSFVVGDRLERAARQPASASALDEWRFNGQFSGKHLTSSGPL
jgi:hypothetical protein